MDLRLIAMVVITACMCMIGVSASDWNTNGDDYTGGDYDSTDWHVDYNPNVKVTGSSGGSNITNNYYYINNETFNATYDANLGICFNTTYDQWSYNQTISEHDALSGRDDIVTNHPNSVDIFYNKSGDINTSTYKIYTSKLTTDEIEAPYEVIDINGTFNITSGNGLCFGDGCMNGTGPAQGASSSQLIFYIDADQDFNDLSGQLNSPATIGSSINTTQGMFGKAMEFNRSGSQGYLLASPVYFRTNLTTLKYSLTDISISMWFKSKDSKTVWNSDWLVTIRNSSSIRPAIFGLQMAVGGNPQTIATSTTGLNFTTSYNKRIDDGGRWHQLIAVYNRSDLTTKIYIDGVMTANSTNITGIMSDVNGQWKVQISEVSYQRGMNGWLDEIMIYDRAISREEAQSFFEKRTTIVPMAGMVRKNETNAIIYNLSTNFIRINTTRTQPIGLEIINSNGSASADTGISFGNSIATNWFIQTKNGINLEFSRNQTGTTGRTSAMTLNADGTMGINSSGQKSSIDVYRDNASIKLYNPNVSKGMFIGMPSTGVGVIGVPASTSFQFKAGIYGDDLTTGTTMFFINGTAGTVGVGTVNASNPLTVNYNVVPQVIVQPNLPISGYNGQIDIISSRDGLTGVPLASVGFKNYDSGDGVQYYTGLIGCGQSQTTGGNGTCYIQTGVNGTGLVTRMIITERGDILIGNTSRQANLTVQGSGYFGWNVSALGFIDRTPAYEGTPEEALNEIASISSTLSKSTGKAELDHSTLPEFAQAEWEMTREINCEEVVDKVDGAVSRQCDLEYYTEEGRDLGAMVTLLTEGVKALNEEDSNLQSQIDTLTTENEELRAENEARDKELSVLYDTLCSYDKIFCSLGGTI